VSEPERSRGWDLAISVGAVVVSVWAAVVIAIVGAFLTPFRIGGHVVPLSLFLVVGGNAAVVWFAYSVTGRRSLALLPGLVWVGVSLLAASRTTEGDLVLIQGNWVATVYLVVGSLAIAGTAYRLFLGPPRR
jgi:hypothetical protein